jgi:hypothetical protein
MVGPSNKIGGSLNTALILALLSLNILAPSAYADGELCATVIAPETTQNPAKVKKAPIKRQPAPEVAVDESASLTEAVTVPPVLEHSDPTLAEKVRVDNTMRMLLPLFEGTKVNAGIAVDHILNEVQTKLTEASNSQAKGAFSAASHTAAAADLLTRQNQIIDQLQKLLSIKNEGFLAFFRRNSVKRQIEAQIKQIEDGSTTLDQITTTIKDNLEKMRALQIEADAWQSAIAGEVAFLKGLIARIDVENQVRGYSRLSDNFNEEILPRLLQQSNNIMSSQLMIAKMISSDLAAKVNLETAALEQILTLRTVSQPLVLRSAAQYLRKDVAVAESIEASEETLSLTPTTRATSHYGELIIGEAVIAWGDQPTDGSKVVSKFNDDTYGILQKNGKVVNYRRSRIARSTPGIICDGIAVGEHVIDRDGKHWRVVGIFEAGTYILKQLVNQGGKLKEREHLEEMRRSRISKFEP